MSRNLDYKINNLAWDSRIEEYFLAFNPQPSAFRTEESFWNRTLI
jgi:hypothetical protein